jgi:N-acetylmuramoyl-L-alanine amidase
VKNGTVEKDVVLAFSLALKARLEATGRYRVMMTRDTDVFIPLDDRRAFAEKHQASLFIAVHADEAQPHARGATIYSLRDSVADDLKRSAKNQSGANTLSTAELAKADSSGDSEVIKSWLSDLAVREVDATKKRASTFSQDVIEFMGADTTLHDNPDRTAAFRVLKTAKVPAVLIELAYVSNEQDAKLLKSDQWRAKVSGSIVTAVDNYFNSPISRLPM